MNPQTNQHTHQPPPHHKNKPPKKKTKKTITGHSYSWGMARKEVRLFGLERKGRACLQQQFSKKRNFLVNQYQAKTLTHHAGFLWF